jgi:hypothetical protein
MASESLAPSLPPLARPGIVFRLERIETASWIPVLTLYDDGRLLRWDSGHDSLTVQRLNAAGTAAFVAEVQASGSFAASHLVPLEPLPGVEPPGIDPPSDRFTLAAAGGEPIVVVNTPYHDPLFFQESAERESLIALAERVMDPSWLPADAWVDSSPAPFVPDSYLVFSGVYSMTGICPSGSVSESCQLDVSTLVLPFELPPDGFGAPFTSADGTESVVNHCAVITPATANALAVAVWPKFGTAAGHLYLAASIPWRERSSFYDLSVRPVLPEETATCEGKSLPPTIGS